MKTGTQLIYEERQEHFIKHNRTIEDDINLNHNFQLNTAACNLCYEAIEEINCRDHPLKGHN